MEENNRLAAKKSGKVTQLIQYLFNKYTLRFKVSLALSSVLAFAVLASSFVIYQVVERVILKQAEESLYDQVRDTERTVRLMAEGSDNNEILEKRITLLKNELKSQRILKTGYYYILNSDGRFILHPSKEGQNVLEGKDLDGKPIFKTILAMNEGRLNYRWLNSETNLPQDKVAVCKKIESLNWSVCASLNESEIYESIIGIRWATAMSCLVLVLLIGPIGHFLAGKLQDYLLVISKRLLSTAVTLTASSRLIATSSQKIDENSVLQGSAVHETVSAVEEIKYMSERNAESADGTNEKVREAVCTSKEGAEAVNTLTLAIDDIVEGNDRIQKQINFTNDQLGNIVNVIREIDSKTKVINEIVFQTKLLSFNAAVEAARAGEHGKGFAVVAEEVGNLARMSGKASEEISSMLSANVQNVEQIIKETQESIGKLIIENKGLVERGSREAHMCGKAFFEMGSQIKNIEELSTTIAVASKEQARGVEEIGKSMNHLNQILTENARISEETAAASGDLNGQNAILSELAHDLAWSILGTKIQNKLDPESEKAIDGGLVAHAEWKSRLIKILSGTSTETINPEVVCKDDQCNLGKWIHSNGHKKYGKTKQFIVLRESHAEFHRVAGEVLKKVLKDKEADKDLIALHSPFGQASSSVIDNLVSLKFIE